MQTTHTAKKMFRFKYFINDSAEDWVLTIKNNIDNAVFRSEISGHLWAQFLMAFPEDAEKCSFEKLTAEDWSLLLAEQKTLSRYCPAEILQNITPKAIAGKEDFEKVDFSAEQWTDLLIFHPAYLDICPPDKINWLRFLRWHPEFADRCPWEQVKDHADWVDLLIHRKEFAKYCHWEELTPVMMCFLLLRSSDSDFDEYCSREKFSEWEWIFLLSRKPHYHIHCDISKMQIIKAAELFNDVAYFWYHDFPAEDLGNLGTLYHKKQMTESRRALLRRIADLFPDIPAIRQQYVPREKEGTLMYSAGYLLACAPELFVCHQPQHLTGTDWMIFLLRHPQFAHHCVWESLSGKDWCSLLQKQPQFSEYCNWNLLTAEQWLQLLLEKPEFLQYCPASKQSSWTEKDWCSLIAAGCEIGVCSKPKVLEKLRRYYCLVHADRPECSAKLEWECLPPENIFCIVRHHPEYADMIKWDKLPTSGDFSIKHFLKALPQTVSSFVRQMPHLLEKYAEFLIPDPEFDAEKLDFRKLSPGAWMQLILCKHEVYKKNSMFCKHNRLESYMWREILKKYPELAELCPWSKFSSWELEEMFRENFSVLHFCSWKNRQKLSAAFRLNLFLAIPEYEPFCDLQKFKGSELSVLLSLRPDLADRCNIQSITETEITKIVARQPSLLKYFFN